jgi:hypothetical protein
MGRERLFRKVGAEMDPAAAPLELTHVSHEAFSLALPGAWRERRGSSGLDLTRSDGLERVTINVKKLVAPVAQGALPAMVARVLDDQGREVTNEAAELLEWGEADLIPRGTALEARQCGSCVAGRLQVALLVRATEERILSASLVSRHIDDEIDRMAVQAAFAARAAIIFDRLSD